MTQEPWWVTNPGRLEYELKALDEHNLRHSRDEAAFSAGLLRLNVDVPIEGRVEKLVVVFPDLYPYFRFEIYAPELALDHHQNPFTKALCLVGRSTENWHTKDTLASFLVDRIPQVLRAGTCCDPTEARTIDEEHQAEPYSNYYSYHPGASVVLDASWTIDRRHQSGFIVLGIRSLRAPLLCCAALEVRDEDGRILAEADAGLKHVFGHSCIKGRWLRIDSFPPTDDTAKLFNLLQILDPHANKIDSYPIDCGRLQVRAALFPEEVNNWRQLDNGWLFACRIEPQESWEKHRRKNTRRKRPTNRK